MTKEELFEKHGVDLLRDVAFVEDALPNYPIFRKIEMIMKNSNWKETQVSEALVDYQHLTEY